MPFQCDYTAMYFILSPLFLFVSTFAVSIVRVDHSIYLVVGKRDEVFHEIINILYSSCDVLIKFLAIVCCVPGDRI
ncbi:hypothetical protein F5B20DRAFT_557583 [Whalleya microplaca]|nr:hypothetical protein F5B20DRAFT_557583 [Whalleya microplaca]